MEPEYPDVIDKARLVDFGDPKTIIGWWTPKEGGYAHFVATTTGVDDPDEFIEEVSKRPAFAAVTDWLDELTDYYFSVPYPEHPGYERLATLREQFAADLGWTERPEHPHPTEFLQPKT